MYITNVDVVKIVNQLFDIKSKVYIYLHYLHNYNYTMCTEIFAFRHV